MQDEPTTPDEVQETSPEAPAEQQDTPEAVDYEKRYNDLRPEYDRTNQLVSRAREGDPDALAELGFELAEDPEPEYGQEYDPPDDEGYVDPTDEMRQRLEALEGQLTARQEQEQQQQQVEAEFSYIDGQIADIEKQHERKLTEQEANALGTLALQMRTEQGFPDVTGAYEALDGILTERQKAYVEGKRQAARAPEGVPGVDKVNLNDPRERQAAAARVMEAESDAEQ